VVSALQWYVASPGRRKPLLIQEHDDLRDDKTVFAILKRSGVIDGTLDYDKFTTLIDASLERELSDYDYSKVLKSVESVMTQIGVMPFNESELPPEDPSTF
jgi:hypothetical protein